MIAKPSAANAADEESSEEESSDEDESSDEEMTETANAAETVKTNKRKAADISKVCVFLAPYASNVVQQYRTWYFTGGLSLQCCRSLFHPLIRPFCCCSEDIIKIVRSRSSQHQHTSPKDMAAGILLTMAVPPCRR